MELICPECDSDDIKGVVEQGDIVEVYCMDCGYIFEEDEVLSALTLSDTIKGVN